MQRKLPERQQPPAILLPSLLFSGAACSGRDLLGLLLTGRKCCSTSCLGNGCFDLGMLLALNSGGVNLRCSGDDISSVPSLRDTAIHAGSIQTLEWFHVLNAPPGEEEFCVLGSERWQWPSSQWLSPKSCRLFWGGSKGVTFSCTARVVYIENHLLQWLSTC